MIDPKEIGGPTVDILSMLRKLCLKILKMKKGPLLAHL